jgi:hypothetical protein
VVHGGTLEPFYAKAKLKPIPAARINERVQVAVYRPPSVEVRDHRRKVMVGPPVPRWHASVEAKAAPPKVKAGWYVRPAAPRARLVTGVKVKAPARAVFEVRPPAPRPPRVRIAVARPDVKVRMSGGVKIGGRAYGQGGVAADGRVNTKVPAVRADVEGARGDVEGKVRGNVKVPAVRGKVKGDVKGDVKGNVKVPAVKAKAGVNEKVPAVRGKVEAGANEKVPAVRGKAKGEADVKVKVKAPSVDVKASGGAKGGVKLGN